MELKEQHNQKSKEYYYSHINERLLYAKKYRDKNKERTIENNYQYRIYHKDEIKEYKKLYFLKNKKNISQYQRLYWEKNKEILNKKRSIRRKGKNHERLKNDILFKLRINLSKSIRKSLININEKKAGHWEDEVGYTKQQLKNHLENQFTPEMNWQNYGTYWHIDHRIPISWFKTKEQLINKGWNLNNLQPLEAQLNIEKQHWYVGTPKTDIGIIYL